MSTNSNNNSIASEIDAIIASAMAEYSRARGVDVFENTVEPQSVDEEALPDVIPANSNSILVEETTSRFSSAIWYENILTKTITLAGLGGIGSYVAFLLARMRPLSICLYDDDTVEAANMSGQLYSRDDIGSYKTAAIESCMANYADYFGTITYHERFTASSTPTDIMICGFDNMAARKIFYNAWKANVNSKITLEEKKKCLFIDGRLAAENFQILCITGDNAHAMETYEREYLFSDSEADETICSYKQTSFVANMIGSVMVNLFVNFCANECGPLVPRDLPFYTEYNAETMYFKVVA